MDVQKVLLFTCQCWKQLYPKAVTTPLQLDYINYKTYNKNCMRKKYSSPNKWKGKQFMLKAILLCKPCYIITLVIYAFIMIPNIYVTWCITYMICFAVVQSFCDQLQFIVRFSKCAWHLALHGIYLELIILSTLDSGKFLHCGKVK